MLRQDLVSWQKLNAAAFLASAVAIRFPETHGQPLVSESGTAYLPIYTEPLFATKGEAENVAVIANYTDDAQPFVGIAVYGDSKLVNKALDGLKLHEQVLNRSGAALSATQQKGRLPYWQPPLG